MIDPVTSVSASAGGVSVSPPSAEQINQSLNQGGTIESSVKAVDLSPSNLANPMNEGSVGSVMSGIYDNVGKYDGVGDSNVKVDLVDSLKADMTPEFQATETNKKSSADNSIELMEKVFEKSAFVSMVTQVVSGVGSSVKMLVRQS